ncbi:hypothetical protein D3C75_550200 [compost metagenome]
MYATTNDTLNNQFVRYCEFQNHIYIDARFFHGISLWNSAWETIKQETVAAIFLGNTFFNQSDNQFICNQFTGIHDVFCLFAQL